MTCKKELIFMDRRKFIQGIVAIPLLFSGRNGQAAQTAEPTTLHRDIVLLDAMVAGWQYHQGDQIWNLLKNDTPLTLSREPQNPYDERAIAVFAAGVKLGYVPRSDNAVIAGLIDQNIPLTAHVLWKNKEAQPWERLAVRISMQVK